MLIDLHRPFITYDAADDAGSGEPVEGAADAPVEGVAPEGEGATPEPWTPPEGFGEKFTEWGVEVNDLEQAVSIYKSLQTEQGVIDMFVEAGRSLGLGVKELEQVLLAEGATPAQAKAGAEAAQTDEDDDTLLTKAQVRELLREEIIAPQQQERQQAVQQQAVQAIGGFFAQHEITDAKVQEVIRGYGKAYLQDGDWDPTHIAAALEKGFSDYTTVLERESQAYLARKAKDAATVPTPVGGHLEGGEGDDAPDYATLGSGALAAARQRVRARMREAGEI